MPKPDTEIERALVVGAHPDDIDFGCAGTVATWVDAGIEVTYLLVTRGDQGGFDDTPREQMAAIRETEQRAAAKAVGVTDVRFLDGYRDGWVEPTRELERDIARVIRQVRPQRMIIQSPERNYDRLPASHSDHMATGEAAIRAIYPQRPQPLRLAGAGQRRWPRAVDRQRGLHLRPPGRPTTRRRHPDLRPQDRRAAGAPHPDRAHG